MSIPFEGSISTFVGSLGQGLKELLSEINLLARYKHPNLVSIVGFCEEGDEKILICEYAERGSFDYYLKTVPCLLTWKQRNNICIDAARGLDYLHNRVREHHRVIHRDIKRANILLFDGSWKAKVVDLELLKIGRGNENGTYLIGTLGYCDPRKATSPTRTNNYKEGRLNEIMDPDLKDSADQSLKEFSKIAYQCVHDVQDERPSMDVVLRKLEKALELYEQYEEAACKLQELGDASEIQVSSNGNNGSIYVSERGSFDNYLKIAPCLLTWKQRINLCIDAARVLDYLHNRVGEHHRVIHRDIKSANILLLKWHQS